MALPLPCAAFFAKAVPVEADTQRLHDGHGQEECPDDKKAEHGDEVEKHEHGDEVEKHSVPWVRGGSRDQEDET
jgi:hypothetical protein